MLIKQELAYVSSVSACDVITSLSMSAIPATPEAEAHQ